jgi:hypothetical protein
MDQSRTGFENGEHQQAPAKRGEQALTSSFVVILVLNRPLRPASGASSSSSSLSDEKLSSKEPSFEDNISSDGSTVLSLPAASCSDVEARSARMLAARRRRRRRVYSQDAKEVHLLPLLRR